MGRYWTCSRFADWLRGIAKPKYATSGEWTKWRKDARREYKFRYWLTETALDKLQQIVMLPQDICYGIKSYFIYRWIRPSHAMIAHKSHINRGSYQEIGGKILPCLFNELVDYVEIDLARKLIDWGDAEDAGKYPMPWYKFRHQWRCPEAGLDHIDWESSLMQDAHYGPDDGNPLFGTPTQQALIAITVKELYDWWKEVYPNRPTAIDASGWSALCAASRETDKDDLFGEMHCDPAERKRILDLTSEIDDAYNREDDVMLIKLIKIRQSLWT